MKAEHLCSQRLNNRKIMFFGISLELLHIVTLEYEI